MSKTTKILIGIIIILLILFVGIEKETFAVVVYDDGPYYLPDSELIFSSNPGGYSCVTPHYALGTYSVWCESYTEYQMYYNPSNPNEYPEYMNTKNHMYLYVFANCVSRAYQSDCWQCIKWIAYTQDNQGLPMETTELSLYQQDILSNAWTYARYMEKHNFNPMSCPTINCAEYVPTKIVNGNKIIGPFEVSNYITHTYDNPYNGKRYLYGEMNEVLLWDGDSTLSCTVCDAEGNAKATVNEDVSTQDGEFYLNIGTQNIKANEYRLTLKFNNMFYMGTMYDFDNTFYYEDVYLDGEIIGERKNYNIQNLKARKWTGIYWATIN